MLHIVFDSTKTLGYGVYVKDESQETEVEMARFLYEVCAIEYRNRLNRGGEIMLAYFTAPEVTSS